MIINKYYDVARERGMLKRILTLPEDDRRYHIVQLQPHQFYDKINAHYAKIMLHLDKENKTVSFHSLRDYINLNEKEVNIKIIRKGLKELYYADDSESLQEDFSFIKELHKNRVIDDEIVNKTKRMLNENASPEEIIMEVQKSLAKVVEDKTESLDTLADRTLKYIEQNQLAGMPILKTGLKEFDKAVGTRTNRYFIWAALSTVGKSFTAYDLILRYCKHNPLDQFAIIYFSLEIPREELMLWFICNLTGVTMWRLEGGGMKLTEKEKQSIDEATEYLKTLPIKIVDHVDGINDMELQTKKFVLDNPGKHVIWFLDHHLKVPKKTNDVRQHVADLSGKIQNLVKHNPITAFLLAQLRRDLLADKNAESLYRPSSDYIQESGSLYQDANHVVLLWRPDMYKEGLKLEDTHDMYLIVEKNKTGQVYFDIVVSCTPKYGRLLEKEQPFAAKQLEMLPGEVEHKLVDVADDDDDQLPF